MTDALDEKIVALEAATGLNLSGDDALDASPPSETADPLAGAAAPAGGEAVTTTSRPSMP